MTSRPFCDVTIWTLTHNNNDNSHCYYKASRLNNNRPNINNNYSYNY